MSKGYTGCIDLERLSSSLETLTSLESCIYNTDLTQYFEDIENLINNVNFEHGKCITNYMDSINRIYSTLDDIKKEITNLTDSLKTTITRFSEVDEITDSDIKDLASIYKDTTSSQNISHLLFNSSNINISNNVVDFNNNIDDSIKNFMVNNTLTDYPSDYKSEIEWEESLYKKYEKLNLSEVEKNNLVEKDMSIWRQEQTGSKVTGLAASNVSDDSSELSSLSSKYMEKYNTSREDADVLASLRKELNDVRLNNGTQEQLNSISDRLSSIENKYNINLRKNMSSSVVDSSSYQDGNTATNYVDSSNNGNITKIDPVEPSTQTESSSSYNTVPIGLGIAAAGISGAIGAVIVDNQKYKKKKKNHKFDYYEDNSNNEDTLELEGSFIDSSLQESYSNEVQPTFDKMSIDDFDNTPYHATKDSRNMDKYYDETDDFFYKDDENE